jgi:hypothetical protein
MNRSMEGHAVLAKKGFRVGSYGTGEKVKIPGKTPREPNVYPFGISYDDIYKDLVQKDKKLYTGWCSVKIMLVIICQIFGFPARGEPINIVFNCFFFQKMECCTF